MPYPAPGRASDAVHRWGMLLLMAALLTTFWCLLLWFSAQQQDRIVKESGRELTLMNSAVAQHANGLMRTIETDLRTMELWLQAHPGIDPRHDRSFLALIDEMRRASGGLIDLRMVSTSGKLFYIGTADKGAQADVSDREYFTSHLALPGRAPGLHISLPIVSRVTHSWILPVSWKMASPVGGMLVLFAAIDLDVLSRMHDRIRFKPAGSIMLMRTDGVILSRVPTDVDLRRKNLSTAPMFLAEYGTKPKGSFVSDGSVTDGIERLVSYERLEAYPLTVLVTRDKAEILETFIARQHIMFVIGAAVTLVTLVFTFFLQRSQRALHGAQDELRRLAATDHLTEVMNRRALAHGAQNEFDRAQRSLRDVAVLALDIDHFKRINDTLGHSAGDAVLKECAIRWKAALRGQDLLGRLGGEEFCVVLPETSLEAAEQVAQRLRGTVSEPPLEGAAQATVSIGISCRRPDDAHWTAALERADRALYRAKADGRNCVRTEG
jgi:diguanylate cyclase (GGDEF)-like protein